MQLSAAGLLWIIPALACSSTSSSTPDSGLAVDPAAKLDTLSPADLQALCDWAAQEQGGYGVHIPCDAGPSGPSDLEVAPDQATCVAELSPHFHQPTCTVTVADWMACLKWRLSNWCSAAPPAPTGTCAVFQAGCYGSGSADSGLE
jgi:hypothetical protein